MTAKFNSLTIVLESDVREDDAQTLINAILMLKGVLSVEGNVPSFADYVAESRVKTEVRNRLFEIITSI
jgi:hypothetical protein